MKKVSRKDQRLLAIWAAKCTERVLPFFEEKYPKDARPRKAIEACRKWVRTGVFRMQEIRKASLLAHAAARKAKGNSPACFAARAAGHSVATAHVPQHAYGPSYYALKAVEAANLDNAEAEIAKEFKWQSRHLPRKLRKGWMDWQRKKLPKKLWVIIGKEYIYPKNKEYFKKLIPFAKRIILICKENGISTVIYGSFAHFYHTKDRNMKVNDIDFLIHAKNFPKLNKLLKKNKIVFSYHPGWPGIIIKNGKQKIEVDSVGAGYPRLKEGSLPKDVDKIDFYGIETRMVTLRQLEEIYSVAYKHSKEDKSRILEKIKHLERFLGRKLK